MSNQPRREWSPPRFYLVFWFCLSKNIDIRLPEAGVSYGLFYSLFKTKGNFLWLYLMRDFLSFMEQYYQAHAVEFDTMNPIAKNIDIFLK